MSLILCRLSNLAQNPSREGIYGANLSRTHAYWSTGGTRATETTIRMIEVVC